MVDDKQNMIVVLPNPYTPVTGVEEGIGCPNCGSVKKHEVRDSRPNYSGVKRTRRCSACGENFITTEMPVTPREFNFAMTFIRDFQRTTKKQKKIIIDLINVFMGKGG